MVLSCRLTMEDHLHIHTRKLAFFSAKLEELFSAVLTCGQDILPPELSDEIAATAGEIMVELADHRSDELVRETLENAKRLRVTARTLRPTTAQVVQAGATLAHDVEKVIRQERRAA